MLDKCFTKASPNPCILVIAFFLSVNGIVSMVHRGTGDEEQPTRGNLLWLPDFVGEGCLL